MKKIAIHSVIMLLCLCTLLSMILIAPLTAYAVVITSADEIRGSDFTDRPALAAELDSIFAGNAGIYSDAGCTKLVNTALGTRSVPNNRVIQYVGAAGRARNSGTSCWVYANGVYNALWQHAPGNGNPGKNSEKLDLTGTDTLLLTFENLEVWGVLKEPGVQIRVGSHMIILLLYTREYIIYLDGNGDGKGGVAVRKLTWAEVRKTNAINDNVKYIIQPKLSWLNELYPRAASASSCVGCRNVKITPVRSTYIGFATVNTQHANGAPLRKSPTSSCKGDHVTRVPNGTRLELTGAVRNNLNNLWYQVRYKNEAWYIFHSSVRLDPSELKIHMTAVPTTLQKGKGFYLAGSFSSSCPITTVRAQVIRVSDQKLIQSTLDKTNATYLSIRYLNANQNIRFGRLPKGSYIYKLTVTDSSGNTCTASYRFTVR